MKAHRARKPRRVAPFPAPVSTVAAPALAPPLPRPNPWPQREPLTIEVRSASGTVHTLDPRRWADYGLDRIPVSGEPFRLTVRGVCRQFVRWCKSPHRWWVAP